MQHNGCCWACMLECKHIKLQVMPCLDGGHHSKGPGQRCHMCSIAVPDNTFMIHNAMWYYQRTWLAGCRGPVAATCLLLPSTIVNGPECLVKPPSAALAPAQLSRRACSLHDPKRTPATHSAHAQHVKLALQCGHEWLASPDGMPGGCKLPGKLL